MEDNLESEVFNKSPQLLKTPLPHPDESLMGYILRLTEENFYDTPSWIFDLAGIRVNIKEGGKAALYRADFDFTSLQSLTALDASEIEKLRYEIIDYGHTIKIFNRLIPAKFIRFCSPKVCPICLKEANYYRSVWDLLPFTVCPTHRVILIDKCPNCDRRITWVRKKVCICRCGFDWRDCVVTVAEARELDLTRLILKLGSLSSNEHPITESKDNPLYDLELGDLCRALHFVADYHYFFNEGKHITATTLNLTCHNTFIHAFSAFKDWPENFYGFFQQAERQLVKVLNYYDLHKSICKRCDSKALFFMIAALEDYFKEDIAQAPYNSNFPLIFRRFIDKEHACRRLKISRKWLDVLISAGKLDVYKRRDKDDILVDAQSIISLKAGLSDLVSINMIAKILNVDASDVQDLIYHDYLIPLSGPSINGLPEWKFNFEVAYNLIERIQEKVVNVGPDSTDKLISANDVIRKIKACGLNVKHFVQAVLEGKITPQKNLPVRRLTDFAFSNNQITEFLQIHQIQSNKHSINFGSATMLLRNK